ncbi:MAG: hypothetical protein HKO56_06785 [Bacteroidia bacterium]|nr:hypothetical protein [Bacteroidia bacterium]NNC84955.1 hypothetical protein [Bacteroidia bacterium]NNM16345.1 hypothetical protein [Bacteroidia bacterium]
MIRLIFSSLLIFLLFSTSSSAQDTLHQNTGEILLGQGGNMSIRGYAQIDYNQKIDSDIRYNGALDVHRFVLFVGYKFSDKTSFISELEVEHANEFFVEQAFLNHNISRGINFRAGMLLIPMGIVNEYHEPTTFHGVERPNLDKYIVPTTWREIGAGFQGNIQNANLKYQAYVVNGFKSFDVEGLLRGSDGLRKGRQKGIKSILSHPNLSGKVSYYGIKSLNIGASAYLGKTSSTLYNNLASDADSLTKNADSSVVGVNMVGLDARYEIKGVQIRGQYIFAILSNTKEYNAFTNADLGNQMQGYYVELAYEVMQHLKSDAKTKLYPFVRIENYNTHYAVEGLTENKAYNRNEITTGLTYKIHEGVDLKADMQFLDNDAIAKATKQLNIGVGVWF